MIIGKGGQDSNPLPPRNAGKTTAKTGKAEMAGGDAMQGRFEAGVRVAVELRLQVVNSLPEVAIEAGSLRFERFRVFKVLRGRDLLRERFFRREITRERS